MDAASRPPDPSPPVGDAPWQVPAPHLMGPAAPPPASSAAPRSVTRDLLAYLRQPTAVSEGDTGRSRRSVLARLLGLSLLLALLTGPISAAASRATGADNRLNDVPWLWVLVAGLTIAPLLEELTFRLLLAPPRPWWFLVSAAGLATAQVWLGAAAFGAALVALAVPSLRRALPAWWVRHFRAVFYVAAVGFGLAHAGNWRFDRPGVAVAVIPLLVLPQALIGLVFGYARVQLGLRWSIALHAAYNGTVLALAALAMSGGV